MSSSHATIRDSLPSAIAANDTSRLGDIELLRSLSHENVATLYEFLFSSSGDNGNHYIVGESIGSNLCELIDNIGALTAGQYCQV